MCVHCIYVVVAVVVAVAVAVVVEVVEQEKREVGRMSIHGGSQSGGSCSSTFVVVGSESAADVAA